MLEKPKDQGEGSSELHDLMGHVQNGVVVDTEPCVVDNHMWMLVVFYFDGHRG